MEWNKGLDTESSAYKFATDCSRVIRVIAGPGTGKSFGLKRRVARLIEEGQDPKRILAVTFTRTAAQDLKNEIKDAGVKGSDKVIAKTLHSLCFGMLNQKSIIQNTGRYPRLMLEFEQKPMLYDIDEVFGGVKKKKERIRAFEAAWARLQSEEPGFPIDDMDKEFQRQIVSWLKSHRAMLFGEMIIEAYHYLKNNPACSERRQFDHILVDEYQDLNKAEQAVIDMLSQESSVAIIGDDDQSIYSFRFANPGGIREFSFEHPGCDAIDFDKCRRCPKRVVYMASRLISNNPHRILGDLQPYDGNQEGIVHIFQWESLNDEIDGICEIVQEEIMCGRIQPEDVLILSPAAKIGYRVRDKLVNMGINAKSYFHETAISTDDLKHKFSILTLLANNDDMVSLRYLLGEGNGTFHASGYKHLLAFALENNISTKEALEGCISGKYRIPYVSSLLKKYQIIVKELEDINKIIEIDRKKLVDLLSDERPEQEDFRNILMESIENSADNEQDIKKWIKKVYSGVLEKISFPENTTPKDHVRIMSLHASKGLSAKYVVVMSAIDGLIPRVDKDSEISEERQIEEQRRLFYVAITRCKSSAEGYPGTLIISSFVTLPDAEALSMKVPVKPFTENNTTMTRFIREFEETAPMPELRRP